MKAPQEKLIQFDEVEMLIGRPRTGLTVAAYYGVNTNSNKTTLLIHGTVTQPSLVLEALRAFYQKTRQLEPQPKSQPKSHPVTLTQAIVDCLKESSPMPINELKTSVKPDKPFKDKSVLTTCYYLARLGILKKTARDTWEHVALPPEALPHD